MTNEELLRECDYATGEDMSIAVDPHDYVRLFGTYLMTQSAPYWITVAAIREAIRNDEAMNMRRKVHGS